MSAKRKPKVVLVTESYQTFSFAGRHRGEKTGQFYSDGPVITCESDYWIHRQFLPIHYSSFLYETNIALKYRLPFSSAMSNSCGIISAAGPAASTLFLLRRSTLGHYREQCPAGPQPYSSWYDAPGSTNHCSSTVDSVTIIDPTDESTSVFSC